jgi:hypothetical protein
MHIRMILLSVCLHLLKIHSKVALADRRQKDHKKELIFDVKEF